MFGANSQWMTVQWHLSLRSSLTWREITFKEPNPHYVVILYRFANRCWFTVRWQLLRMFLFLVPRDNFNRFFTSLSFIMLLSRVINFLGTDSGIFSRCLPHGNFNERPLLVSWPLICKEFFCPLRGLVLT